MTFLERDLRRKSCILGKSGTRAKQIGIALAKESVISKHEREQRGSSSKVLFFRLLRVGTHGTKKEERRGRDDTKIYIARSSKKKEKKTKQKQKENTNKTTNTHPTKRKKKLSRASRRHRNPLPLRCDIPSRTALVRREKGGRGGYISRRVGRGLSMKRRKLKELGVRRKD